MSLPYESLITPLRKKLTRLDEKLVDPKTLSDTNRYKSITKERADIEETLKVADKYYKLIKNIADNESLIKEDPDSELAQMAEEELDSLNEELDKVESRLKVLLVPKDPDDDKNIIMEIRAGTGGEEAALFAADLYRMYDKYAEDRGWKVDILSSNLTGVGGFKEIIVAIDGVGVYGDLKFESGIHRVQRVPATEASGRLHTSAASVAVLPEVKEVEVNIDPNDLKIDVFRSSGPGGQSVNTTDSAVRITHLPTGIVVTCQDEKSQHKNKAKALKVLRARLADKLMQEQNSKISQSRKTMVGSGDRSQKIKTYNFPQNRITDHRFGITLYNLDEVLNGDLEELISAAKQHTFEMQIKSKSENNAQA